MLSFPPIETISLTFTSILILELRLDNFQNLDYEGVAIKLGELLRSYCCVLFTQCQLSNRITNIFIVKEIPEVRSIRITRGPQGYDFLPAKLALRSACEFAMDYETVSTSLENNSSMGYANNCSCRYL